MSDGSRTTYSTDRVEPEIMPFQVWKGMAWVTDGIEDEEEVTRSGFDPENQVGNLWFLVVSWFHGALLAYL